MQQALFGSVKDSDDPNCENESSYHYFEVCVAYKRIRFEMFLVEDITKEKLQTLP